MKTRLISIFAGIAAIAAACSDPEPAAKPESFQLDKTSISVGCEAGSQDIMIKSENVTLSADVEASAASWLSAEISARCLTLTFAENSASEERTGTVTVKGGKLEPVTVSVTQAAYIAPQPDGLKFGKKTEDGLGMIYWVSPTDGTVAKAVSLEKTTGKAWSAEEIATGAESLVNGAANMALLMAKDSPADNFPAAFWCSKLGEGWYLPARDELLEIFDIYNGKSHSDADFKAATPSAISSDEASARAAFDAALKSAGAQDSMNGAEASANGDSYWTSTEAGAEGIWFVRFGKFSCESNGVKKTSTTRYIRCVKTIGNYVYPAEPVTMSLDKSALSFEGAAASEEIGMTLKNGSATASVDAESASWCTATVKDGKIEIAVTANETGALRSATVTVTATGVSGSPVTATVAVSQKAANVESFKIGEIYKEGGKAVGIVFWVSEDGQTGKIVSLKRLSGAAWSTEATSAARGEFKQLGKADADDGAANTEEIRKNAKELKVEVPFIAFLDELGEGWYIPAANELTALACAYYGVEKTGDIEAKTPDTMTKEDQKAAMTAFENAIKDNGGDAINSAAGTANGDSIFSSTEVLVTGQKTLDGGTADAYTSATYVRFGKYAKDKGTKDGTSRTFRGVKVVKK